MREAARVRMPGEAPGMFGVVQQQRANPGYLTRRAAVAEHHLNPRRVRACPHAGVCGAAACRP